jgi:quaternary ammonium compound-resistance protein SugE
MSSFTAWALLIVAGLLEVVWAVGLKYTDGFTRSVPSTIVSAAMIVSIVLLGIVAKAIPVGTAYAVWVGIGVVGTVVLGIILLGEPASPMRLVSVGFILIGVVGLKLASAQT